MTRILPNWMVPPTRRARHHLHLLPRTSAALPTELLRATPAARCMMTVWLISPATPADHLIPLIQCRGACLTQHTCRMSDTPRITHSTPSIPIIPRTPNSSLWSTSRSLRPPTTHTARRTYKMVAYPNTTFSPVCRRRLPAARRMTPLQAH
eukprot:Rmarinus@m.18105